MARIAGVNIPNHQHIVIGLTAIFGIGRPRAEEICAATGVDPQPRKSRTWMTTISKNSVMKSVNS